MVEASDKTNKLELYEIVQHRPSGPLFSEDTGTCTSSYSSSAFPAMLDLQSSEWGEVRSLPQCLNQSQKLPVGIRWTRPCLVSQSVKGGAGLQDVVGDLRTCAAWTFVWMGNFQSVEVGEELTASSPQSKDCDLSCSVQLVDAVLFRDMHNHRHVAVTDQGVHDDYIR